jgi:predicted nucleotidyltransferase
MIELKDAITALSDNDVEFVLIGGVAITLHSSAYATEDLDFCYSRANSNLAKLAAALGPFKPRARGLPAELPFIFDESTLRNGTNFTFSTTIGDIDLLAEIAGVGDYSVAKERSVEFTIYDRTVKVLDLDALIAAKQAANRTKDQLVLPELLALREALDPNSE